MDHVRISWPKPRPAIEGPYSAEREGLTVPQIVGAALSAIGIWFAAVCILSLVS